MTDFQRRVKVIKYDKFLEYYEYDLFCGVTRNDTIKNKKTLELIKESTLYRTKKTIQQLLICNGNLNKFLTLNFAFDISYQDSIKEYKRFIRSLRSLTKKPVPYLAVMELTKNQRIHFHCLIDLPFISQDKLNLIWGAGHATISLVRDRDFTINYITKYVTKDFTNCFFKNRKNYLCSLGLKRPEVYYDLDALNILFSDDYKVKSRAVYSSAFIGEVQKVEYYKN